MNESKKNKIFSKKEGMQLLLFIGICALVVIVVALTRSATVKKTPINELEQQIESTDIGMNSIDTNVNESIDNAIEVNNNLTADTGNTAIDSNKSVDTESSNTTINDGTSSKDSNDSVKAGDQEDIANKETNSTVADNNDNISSEKEQLDQKIDSSSDDIAESNIDEEEVAQTSTEAVVAFAKPIEGNVIREYSLETTYSKTLDTWRTKEGIDIKADAGSKVMAVADGIVEKIDNDLTERGMYIVLTHSNGLKSVYSNLSEDVKVIVGQKISKGDVLATVGNTAGNYSEEEYGSHLNFSMYKETDEVDPNKYIKFK